MDGKGIDSSDRWSPSSFRSLVNRSFSSSLSIMIRLLFLLVLVGAAWSRKNSAASCTVTHGCTLTPYRIMSRIQNCAAAFDSPM